MHPVLVCKLWQPARHFLFLSFLFQQNYPTWISVCSLQGELFTAKLDMWTCDMRTCVIWRKGKERRHILGEHPWLFPLTVWQSSNGDTRLVISVSFMTNIDQISAYMLASAAGGSNTQVNQEPDRLRTAHRQRGHSDGTLVESLGKSWQRR